MYSHFVTKTSIDAKKKKRKEFFQEKLEKTKEEYEYVKRKRQLEEERGDKKWMLPSVEGRIEKDQHKSNKKRKKDKHKKKSKKHKKSKHQSSDSSQESDKWEESVESSVKTDTNTDMSTKDASIASTSLENQIYLKPQREDWMMSSSLLDIASNVTSLRENKTKRNKEEKRQKDEAERNAVHQSKELNPYWRDGGKGLPEKDRTDNPATKAETTKNYRVGDGGRSWIEKAYERAKQQAIDEGIPLEEIVTKRWGSMEKLNALLKVARRSVRSSSHTGSNWRKTSDKQREHRSSCDNNKRYDRHSQAHNESDRLANHKNTEESRSFHHKKTESHVEMEDLQSSKRIDSNSIKVSSEQKEISTKRNVVEHDKQESESESESEESSNEAIEMQPLTEKEKNELGAKIIRAELMGDEETAAKLKMCMELGNPVTVRKAKKEKLDVKKASDDDEERDMILTRSDKHGNLYPVKLQTDVAELDRKMKRKKKKMMSTHDADGQRVKYFEDDDNADLKTLVQQERLTSASDQQAMMSRLAGKHLGATMGDDYTLDDMFVAASATKGTAKAEDKRIKEKAVAEHKQRELQQATCRFCFENPNIAKHLIIAIGIRAYLALPINASLTDGHCLIIPMHHVTGQTFLDEDVIQEVKIFKKGLTRMFSDMDEDLMFVETCKNLRRQNHCVIECIPVPKDIGDMAPIYFKKAIMECESDWNTNKKLVTITAADGLSKAIPKGLPYFAVEFGLDGGFAHVIEQEESFPYFFGKEIIGGMMDLEPRLWRKPPKESFEQHKRKVLKFAESWKPYDWTAKLK